MYSPFSLVLAKPGLSRFNHCMEEGLDRRRIDDINQIGWEDRRRAREEATMRRAVELQVELNNYHFYDEDARCKYTHEAIMDLNLQSPYLNRTVHVDGRCGWRVENKVGASRIKWAPFKDIAAIDRGFTVVQRDKDDGTEYAVMHCLETTLRDDGVVRSIVVPLSGGADLWHRLNADDYVELLRAVLPADMMDMFERLTDVYSDDQLQAAVGMLARMRVDTSHISQDTMVDIADYVSMRLGVRNDAIYMVALNEHLYLDEKDTYKIAPEITDVFAAHITDLVLAREIDGEVSQWFAELKFLAASGVHAREGTFLAPLSSIDALQLLDIPDDGEGEDVGA